MDTERGKVKVVLLCCPGRFQTHLANLLHQDYELAGIVICQPTPGNQSLLQALLAKRHYLLHPVRLFKHLYTRLCLRKYEQHAEKLLQENYQQFMSMQSMPEGVSTVQVDDINCSSAIEFVKTHKPDIVCVNGTNLLRQPMLSATVSIPLGVINLHTGLSPYARGGNCNLFMLLEGKPEYVGATIHYIDAGIDSGDIIRTLRPDFKANDPYEYIEAKVFIDGNRAMVDAVAALAEQSAPRVQQWIKGKEFLRRTGYCYNPSQRLRLNRLIEQGLLARYKQNQSTIDSDAELRLIV